MPRRARKTSKKAAAKGKRYAMNMRTTAEVRQQLEAAASSSGRSLAQEIEFRIERSLLEERSMIEALELSYGPELAGILLMLGEAMKDAGRTTGFMATHTLEGSQRWWDNAYAFSQAHEAALTVLDAMKPPGEPSPPPSSASESWGLSVASTVLEEAATGYTRTDRTVERARRLHRLIGPLAERLSDFTTPEFRYADSHLGDNQ